MGGTYNRTESYLDWDQDQDVVEREEHTKFIRNRRRLVLMSVVLIFLLTTVVMVTSVVYVEMNKDVVGYMVRLKYYQQVYGIGGIWKLSLKETEY